MYLNSVFNNRVGNNLNFIRLVVAILVIYSHAFPLSKGGHDILYSLGWSFGSFSVSVFFFLSGLLVTNSFENSKNIFEYIFSRFIRIMPAYIVVILISAFILGPLFTSLEIKEYFSNYGTYQYLKNLLFFPLYWELPGVFNSNPYYQSINGSLWSLPLEILCYVYVLILGFFTLLRSKEFSILAFIIIYFLHLSPEIKFNYFGFPSEQIVDYSLYFLLGIIVFNFKNYIYLDKKYAMMSILVLLISMKFSFFKEVFIYFGTYLILYFGYQNSFKYTGYFQKNDFSYGMYIYAFPIQQVFVYVNGGDMNPYINFIYSFVITSIFAFFSWNLIEKRLLKLKHNKKIIIFLESKFSNIKSINIFSFYKLISWKSFVLTIFILITFDRWYYRPITNISFPNDLRKGIFDNGWLPQGEGETYRWISKEATLNLGKITSYQEITVEGFVPEKLKNIKKLEIYLNNQKIFDINIEKDRYFNLTHKFNNEIFNSKDVIILFKYDNVYIPDYMELDVRRLSGFIKRITLK